MKHNTLLNNVYKYYAKSNEDKNLKDVVRKKRVRQKKSNSEEKDILLSNIKNIASDYYLVDWTDKNSCCFEFKILLHKEKDILDDDVSLMNELGGVRRDLRIFVSVLEPYYYTFIEETRYLSEKQQWFFATIECLNEDYYKLISMIDDYFAKKSYHKINNNSAKMIVSDVETEFKGLHETRVFNCLFTDTVDL